MDNELLDTIATVNDYMAFDHDRQPISTNAADYSPGEIVNLMAFLDNDVEWCGIDNPRDAISWIEEESWDRFIANNPGLLSEW